MFEKQFMVSSASTFTKDPIFNVTIPAQALSTGKKQAKRNVSEEFSQSTSSTTSPASAAPPSSLTSPVSAASSSHSPGVAPLQPAMVEGQVAPAAVHEADGGKPSLVALAVRRMQLEELHLV